MGRGVFIVHVDALHLFMLTFTFVSFSFSVSCFYVVVVRWFVVG
jgi:hypothetical protein